MGFTIHPHGPLPGVRAASRLKKTARWFRIAGKDIAELAQMPIDELHAHMTACPASSMKGRR
jgi:excinuclease UvrABC ATPase subunit